MEKINVLLVSGVLTSEHNYRRLDDLLVRMLESTGRFSVKVTEEFNGATERTLAPYQLILLNYDGKIHIQDQKSIYWDEETLQLMSDFVSRGGGIAYYHSSISAWVDTPQVLLSMAGAYIMMEKGGRRHPNPDIIVDIAAPEHPITKGLSPHFMIPGDDFLCGLTYVEGAQVEVLATSFDDISVYPADYPPPHLRALQIPDGDLSKLNGINTDQPVAWTNRYGKGRAFCLSLGHDIDTMRRVDFLTMLVRGCEWAATGEVTLDPPDRTGENRFKPWPYY